MSPYKKIDTLIGRGGPNPNNPYARVAVCLCLDTSGSMTGHPINELNAGVKLFYDAIKRDSMASACAEIAIVTFGEGGFRCVQKFSSVNEISQPPTLEADGMTPLGEAVNLALDLLTERKGQYSSLGIEYYQPWLVIMTDGQPKGSDKAELSRAAARASDMVESNKLTVFPIGIGNEASREALEQFSPRRKPVKLKGLNFKKFFMWLSASVQKISVSKIGEKVSLPNISSWAEEWGTL